MPSGRPYHAPAPDPDVIFALSGIVEDEEPDVVHAHNWMVSSFLPLKRTSDAGLVMTLHDYSVDVRQAQPLLQGRPSAAARAFASASTAPRNNYGTARGEVITLGDWATHRPLRRTVDYFVPVSDAVARATSLARRGRGVRGRPELRARRRRHEGADADHPGVAISRSFPTSRSGCTSGTSRTTRASTCFSTRTSRCRRATTCDHRSPLARGPQSFPKGSIELTDLPHDAVMAAWRRAALGIVPSLFPDPCPTVALEAMACGVPVVGSRNGGLPDIVVDGKTGLLFDVGDVQGLASALAAMRDDDARLKEMSDAARTRAGLFMASNVIGRIENVYGRLVS